MRTSRVDGVKVVSIAGILGACWMNYFAVVLAHCTNQIHSSGVLRGVSGGVRDYARFAVDAPRTRGREVQAEVWVVGLRLIHRQGLPACVAARGSLICV